MRIVVSSEAFAVPGVTLPVHSPRGLALLGARAGRTVLAQPGEGRIERLRVLAVPYQPEAACSLARVGEGDVVPFPPGPRHGGPMQGLGGDLR